MERKGTGEVRDKRGAEGQEKEMKSAAGGGGRMGYIYNVPEMTSWRAPRSLWG